MLGVPVEQAQSLPDLILLDLLLPHLNGFEVVRRLKANQHTRHIPVLALTALTRPSERDEALAAGCDGLIVKPFDTDELIRTVGSQYFPGGRDLRLFPGQLKLP
jgi:two-component system cell cycle response regulator